MEDHDLLSFLAPKRKSKAHRALPHHTIPCSQANPRITTHGSHPASGEDPQSTYRINDKKIDAVTVQLCPDNHILVDKTQYRFSQRQSLMCVTNTPTFTTSD